MNFNFDTASMSKTEAAAVIALLSVLFPQPGQAQELVPVSDPPSAATPTLQPSPNSQPIFEVAKRGRRTKAQIEADAATAANPTQGDVPTAAAESTVTESAKTTDASPMVATNGQAKTISADELRGLLNGYIQRHSMDEAIGKLKSFECNRVTEALDLEPAKLSELAEALRG